MNAPTLISVLGLQVYAKHGVFAEEKKRDQLFVTDLFVTLSAQPHDDELSTTVDYSYLVDLVTTVFGQKPVDLIETLANDIAGRVLSVPNVAAVKVVVHKPTVELSRPISDVSVTVEASR